MGRINMGRVVLGGLVAGLIINVSEFVLNGLVLGEQINAALGRLNLPMVGGGAIGTFVLLGFILGIATIWLYAAIRPRYGAGPSTALCAGSAVWFFAYLYPGIGMWVMGFFPARVMCIGLIWGLAEILIGAVAGAALYQEEGSPIMARS